MKEKTQPIKIIFMGTSEFAVPSLEALINSPFSVLAVVSQPDRPRGRGKRLQPTPVKEAALRYNLDVYQFPHIKDAAALEVLSALHPDLLVVVSYGQIIPDQLLQVPALGSINLHASLLPHLRGAAPLQRAIMAGETETGNTTMLMDAGLDTGDILLQEKVAIDPDMDHGQLQALLAEKGAVLLNSTIMKLARGELAGRPQNQGESSYAAMISREEELIDWSAAARIIHNLIRALSPAPGAYTILEGQRIKIFRSRVHSCDSRGQYGKIINCTPDGLMVQTGEGCLEILELQKEGKKRMKVRDFIKGCHQLEGSTFQ